LRLDPSIPDVPIFRRVAGPAGKRVSPGTSAQSVQPGRDDQALGAVGIASVRVLERRSVGLLLEGAVRAGAGRQTRYSYTERGLIKTISTDEGTISYTYDGAGRVIEQTAYTEANGHTYRTRYRYAGRTVTEERGAYITTYTLDGWGKPILKTNGGGWAEKKVIIFMYQLIKRKDM